MSNLMWSKISKVQTSVNADIATATWSNASRIFDHDDFAHVQSASADILLRGSYSTTANISHWYVKIFWLAGLKADVDAATAATFSDTWYDTYGSLVRAEYSAWLNPYAAATAGNDTDDGIWCMNIKFPCPTSVRLGVNDEFAILFCLYNGAADQQNLRIWYVLNYEYTTQD